MTIRRGVTWGERLGPLPDGAPIAASDAELREILLEARRRGAVPTVGLVGGDVHQTLGGGAIDPNRLRSDGAVTFLVDAVEVRLDATPWTVFVAHLVAGRLWGRRHTFVAANAAFAGPWQLGPRAHLNDGLVDLTEGRLPARDRRAARRRAAAGMHVPHPALRERRVRKVVIELPERLAVRLDGVDAGHATRLELRVAPDAARVVV